MKINGDRDFGTLDNSDKRALNCCLREFSKALQVRLDEKKDTKSGWDNEQDTPVRYLEMKLRESLDQGNMVDVANYAMFIWNRQDASSAESSLPTVPNDSDSCSSDV